MKKSDSNVEHVRRDISSHGLSLFIRLRVICRAGVAPMTSQRHCIKVIFGIDLTILKGEIELSIYLYNLVMSFGMLLQ